jgi:DNA-binding transcriptional MerR regulator
MTNDRGWKVGELAQATGLTVRTLHHYDHIGLLKPSARNTGGHRVYLEADVVALYRIISLRGLGLRLDQIKDFGASLPDARDVLAEQLRQVDRRLAVGRQLRETLVSALARLDAGETIDVVPLIKETTFSQEALREHLGEEEVARLSRHTASLGVVGQHAIGVEWPQLYARAQAEMEAGTPAEAPQVRAIVDRMDELSALFNEGEPRPHAGVRAVWLRHGGSAYAELVDYLDRARAARDA